MIENLYIHGNTIDTMFLYQDEMELPLLLLETNYCKQVRNSSYSTAVLDHGDQGFLAPKIHYQLNNYLMTSRQY